MANKNIYQTWAELKAKHPDAIILFRTGNFYKALQEDAAACARDLGITVKRNADTDKTQQASFPIRALDTYLPKLIRAGHRVAICDFD
jgi:DNA mismatch repair protein MutS